VIRFGRHRFITGERAMGKDHGSVRRPRIFFGQGRVAILIPPGVIDTQGHSNVQRRSFGAGSAAGDDLEDVHAFTDSEMIVFFAFAASQDGENG